MREIVLDTETTGLDAKEHRLVEIGCVELSGRVLTGRTFQAYINPERDMPEDAFRIHGLSQEFLAGQPVFAEIAEAFLAFIGDAPLIAHNAEFDMGFINAELRRLDLQPLDVSRAVDTLPMARARFPNERVSLDALCTRFHIDRSRRKERHGALLDAELLASVYIELTGGRQESFQLDERSRLHQSREFDQGYELDQSAILSAEDRAGRIEPKTPRFFPLAPSDLDAHQLLVGKMDNPLWTADVWTNAIEQMEKPAAA